MQIDIPKLKRHLSGRRILPENAAEIFGMPRKCKYHPDGQTCLICQGEQ